MGLEGDRQRTESLRGNDSGRVHASPTEAGVSI